ncbi:uncharacterized protein LOC105833640 isoform X3 [Monomorium pharaonis]|uniref:uncharacterized protein LOC105833640 isoform X3 n=1 Tax=Monomorium pharaonis TaxID=307658 RepID=UPI00174733C9|nr:uncharacterized protein LOC105833640 isoform X3 [Monomorium pharaonis]
MSAKNDTMIDSDDKLTPSEIDQIAEETTETTEKTTENLPLPHRSQQKYLNTYQKFMDWKAKKKFELLSENVMLTYFKELSDTRLPPSLWSIYSMLKRTLIINDNINISCYKKLRRFLSKEAQGFQPKITKVLTTKQIKKFLDNAPDHTYLSIKVAMILGICGACRRRELTRITINDIEDKQKFVVVRIPATEHDKPRSFLITEEFYSVFKKYFALRPKNVQTSRFFLTYRNGQCTSQPIGVNKFGNMPTIIASYLKLQDPHLYTFRTFRRTSAALFADSDITTLKRCDSWKSNKVTEEHERDSFDYKIEICDEIPSAIINTPTSTSEAEMNTKTPIKLETLENDSKFTSLDIFQTAEKTTENLLPSKSKDKYLTTYNKFMNWKAKKKFESLSENIMLTYFMELSNTHVSSTLWTIYSMLRSTLSINNNINISYYKKVRAFLKKQAIGFQTKKSKVLTIEQIKKFLDKAPDRTYLVTKVAMIFGICGACKRVELTKITINDIQDKNNVMRIKIPITKNYKPNYRSFVIKDEFYDICKKYIALRPQNVQTSRFFLNYQHGKCTAQPIGINKFGRMPMTIASYLKLPDSSLYTGHAFRRTSATLLADSGVDLTTILKQHNGWKFNKVTKEHKDSFDHKNESCDQITNTTINTSISTLQAPKTYSKLKNNINSSTSENHTRQLLRRLAEQIQENQEGQDQEVDPISTTVSNAQASTDSMPKIRMYSRSVLSTRPTDMTLNLECTEEPLSEAQQMSRTKHKEDYDKVTAILEELVKDHGGKLISQVGTVSGYQYTLPTVPTTAAVVQNNPQILNVTQQNKNSIKLNIGNTSGSQGNIQLVVDPRMGVILGPVTQTQGTTTTTTSVASTPAQPQQENYKYTRSGRRTKVFQVQQPDIIEEPAPSVTCMKPKSGSTHIAANKVTSTTSQSVTNVRIKTIAKTVSPQSTVKPTEHTSIGGIAIGKNSANEQIDESKKNQPDGREFMFNKTTGGRTFPSLVVVARPNLRNKDITSPVAQKERQALDAKVKSVLMFSATKFAEWLIQQGLVKSEQYCLQHGSQYQKPKLKLGMYSDQGTFPYSGGYVWISNCCPDRFVSVFSGSIFQGAHYTPTVLLKLIYHWACQTNVQNVISWVKVSNIYLKSFYTNIRSICTAAVWDKTTKMGGKNVIIQVGVISLGTTSQDGHLRQVKVEVLGVLDPSTLDIRLRACEPIQDGDKSFKKRFNNILHPLKEWVHTDSKIMTDFTVDKSTLHDMGYHHVMQSSFSEQSPRNIMSNYHIMEYLRKIVPRMFQNTLSLLSRQVIQQFLDELIWREMYGATAERAFDNIIRHIAEQTRIDSNDSLLDRLSKIALNPFKDWSYSMLSDLSLKDTPSKDSTSVTDVKASSQKTSDSAQIITVKQGARRGRKRIHPVATPEHEIKRIAIDPKSNKEKEDKSEKEQIQLQELYYATMEGDKNLILKESRTSLHFKCFLCTTVMRSNTEVMEHMVSHVPPQVPGQSELSICRYCCTPLSSQHQMLTHVSETHSNFGHSDSDMVVCAICEEKYGKSKSLIDHLTLMHYPSEMPYQCESCGYRTSSHKDVIDHYYKTHEKGEGLQCPYCLKVIQFVNNGNPNVSNVYAYLSHMQRHIVRRDQGKGKKCPKCCLWFNQKSSLTIHQRELHDCVINSKVVPYSASSDDSIMIPKVIPEIIQFSVDSPQPELPPEKIQKWNSGPITVNTSVRYLSCQECEEDIDEEDHYPGEQRCQQCRYVTCCWRAFKEHQQQIHNERPKTSLIVPSPLVNVPLDKKLQCSCGYTSNDGNRLARHLIKCKRLSARPVDESTSSGMLDSLGLIPRTVSEVYIFLSIIVFISICLIL